SRAVDRVLTGGGPETHGSPRGVTAGERAGVDRPALTGTLRRTTEGEEGPAAFSCRLRSVRGAWVPHLATTPVRRGSVRRVDRIANGRQRPSADVGFPASASCFSGPARVLSEVHMRTEVSAHR